MDVLNPYCICATACDWKFFLLLVLMRAIATINSSSSQSGQDLPLLLVLASYNK